MPRTSRYRDFRVIEGPGLDEILEPGDKIVLLDDYYADLYGDYIFLGYDTYAAPFRVDRADLAGLHNAAELLDSGSGIIVCGKNPSVCLYAVAAREALDGSAPGEALEKAARLLEPIYQRNPLESRTGPGDAALLGLTRSIEALGPNGVRVALGLAANYEYGLHGSLHYGETVSWAAVLGASPDALAAALLHFLVEGPGEPATILRRRLEAVGEASLEAAIGPRAENALAVLRSYASGRYENGAAVLALVEALEPGRETLRHVARNGAELLAYCPGTSEEGPSRGCVSAVDRARRFFKASQLELERARILLDEPPPLAL